MEVVALADFFKGQSRLYANPKLLRISGDAFRLAVFSWGWSSDHETDGHVPKAVLPTIGARPKLIRELVDNGLWHANGDGYVINDYLVHNRSKAELDAARAKWREKKEGQRKRPGGGDE